MTKQKQITEKRRCLHPIFKTPLGALVLTMCLVVVGIFLTVNVWRGATSDIASVDAFLKKHPVIRTIAGH